MVTETIIDTAPGDPGKSPQAEVKSYPLDGVELDSVSNEDLAKLLFTAPVLYEAGSNRIVRISKEMVLKGSGTVSKCEGETQRFAAAHGLQVPTVHRIFSLIGFYPGWPEETGWFMVMDFVPGTSLEDAWPDLDTEARESVTAEVAEMINKMQSLDLVGMPPGPIGHEGDEPWRGPYFTAYGTGPFRTLKEMEDWYNHKLDVCIRLTQAKADVPRFAFERAVLTHQDIAPRNLVIRDEDQKICLIDFSMSGIYPVGFEQAALARQAFGKWDKEFREMVLSKLAYRGDLELRQLRNVMYGLTTGVLL
ncbi:C6 zinc finger domain protein [Colletotrichum truncatum]|uniref:C6 zinc finger domain protein n=1 Tax=Colletotrichum truncatum TaxID=5467 RepID=A0ACC3YF66_COLTU|nr:C6 zinc finger domain protein [Colletotrichum truncatum]KAF6788210.1 C6 zinc finger domain protein [Colletotrichum truncatum]